MLPLDAETSPTLKPDQQRESLFVTLKQALKARGVTYASLAAALDVSELTIKRLFSERDCKMSRLTEICEAVGISLAELVEMQSRRRQVAGHLPLQTEKALANEPALFLLFMLLTLQIDKERICREWAMSETDWYRRLRALEELGLIRLLPQNRFRFTVTLPVRWRMNGPLGHFLQQVNGAFVKHCIRQEAAPDVAFCTGGRLMSAQSAETMREAMRALHQQFEHLATQDQLFFSADELRIYKLVGAFAPMQIESLLPPAGKKARDRLGDG
ncbi:MAG: helix-turn-helix transcriptional regulator [Gammaproteobacteria bacterium]|nr:helix-turn-helix transcriptional regulator [Gammaproteobacteria bacterium]